MALKIGGARGLAVLAGMFAVNLQFLVFQRQVTTLHSAWGWSAGTVKCRSVNYECKSTNSMEIAPNTKCEPKCEAGEETRVTDRVKYDEHLKMTGVTCEEVLGTNSTLGSVICKCPDSNCKNKVCTNADQPDNNWWFACPAGSGSVGSCSATDGGGFRTIGDGVECMDPVVVTPKPTTSGGVATALPALALLVIGSLRAVAP
jgi:hypothetical protein